MPLNPFDAEKHHIALGAGVSGGPINYLDIAPDITMGYWYRLGEGPWPVADTLNFALDSSGHGRHLAASVDPGGGSTNPDAPTCHISGALDSFNDDGAMRFNNNTFSNTSSFDPQMLQGPNTAIMEPPFRTGSLPIGSGSTFTAWVAFEPAGAGDSFWPDNLAAQTNPFALISTWKRNFGIGNTGVKLGFAPATGKLGYRVGALNLTPEFFWQTPHGLVPGEWNHFTSTIQKISSTVFQRKIYLNATKLLDVTGVLGSAEIGGGAIDGAGLSIGGGYYNDIWDEAGRGKVDEVAYWNGVLTDRQIEEVWQYTAPRAGKLSGPVYGFTLENAYAKFAQKETKMGGSDFGGTLDLIASDKPEVSRWTQDEFTGGAFQYSFDTDQAMFADCISYMPSQQSKSLTTVAPVFFKKAFNPEAQSNPGGRSNTTIPHSMFTVAGSIFVGFEHGILRYLTDTDATVWGNTNLDPGLGVHAWYAAADYDRNEQCIYALVNFSTAGQKPYLIRLDPETLALFGTFNQTFNNAPERTRNQLGYGMQVNDQHIVLGIGLRLYTVDPPEKPSDPTDLPVWTHIGRLPGRWIDSVPYNGMTYILTSSADSKTQVVAFDGTYILPIANLAFNFSGRCMAVYGGRVYIGGVGTDISGEARYAELHELTGSSTRLVRTFAPESYQSHTPFPKEIWDLTVAEGLLWWSEKNVRLWTYDLTGDAFFGSSMIQHPNVNFYTQVVGRERLWLWGSHDTLTGQHGIYRVAIAGDTVAPYEGTLTTSDFLTEFALEKRWHEIVILSRYHEVNRVEYSTDGGATWGTLGAGVASTEGDLKFLTFPLDSLPTSKVMRFRIHQPMGTIVDDYGELIAYTVSFSFTSPTGELKHGWNLIINGAENVEARDGTNQYQDVDTMKAALWEWADSQATLTYLDLGGKIYTVKMQDFVEQQPIIGPNVTNGVGPEAYFAVTLLEV